MNRDEILNILDKLTTEDSVSYILDGTISEEDVIQSKTPSSVKEDIISTYKQVLVIRQRIVDKEREREKIQTIEYKIVSDEKEYERPCHLVSKDLKYGYQTSEGKMLIPVEFEEIIPIEGFFFIVKYKGKYGCWHYGKKIADYRYDHIFFIEQLNCFQIGEIRRNGEEYWGLINRKGEMLLSANSLSIALIDNTRVLIIQSYSKTYKFATVSSDGKLDELYISSENYELDGIRYCIVKDPLGKYGVLDVNFIIAIPVEYESLKSASFVWNKLFIARRDKLYGVVDLNGNVILPLVYDSIEFKNDEFIISKGGIMGVANKKGQIVLTVKYSDVGRLSNGLRSVFIDSKWGYVDITENTVIPFVYDKARDFFGDYAIVKKGKLFGVIDRHNSIVVPFKYEDIISYEDLDAIVVNEFGLEGVIDLKTGNNIPCQYAEIHPKYRDKTTNILRCYVYTTSHRSISFCNAPKRHPNIVDVVSLDSSNGFTIDNQYKDSDSYAPKLKYGTIEGDVDNNCLHNKSQDVLTEGNQNADDLESHSHTNYSFDSSASYYTYEPVKPQMTQIVLEEFSNFIPIKKQGKLQKVYSSIFAPSEIKRVSPMIIQVYLHLQKETEKVRKLARESQKGAKRRDYIPLDCKLRKGDKVDVHLNIYGETLLMSDKKSIVWQGSFTKCSFDYFVPKDIYVDELSCAALLSVNGVPVGEMRFITHIVDSPRQLNPEIIAHKYNKVFISYAHKDEARVKSFHEGLKLAGIEHFFDRAYLNTGDIFPQVIRDYINSADLFVLFWSENAAQSEYVDKERKQALERAFPQVQPEKAAKLRIYPMSIEPHAELPGDMKENYHFGEM